jgi:hypothetical protein
MRKEPTAVARSAPVPAEDTTGAFGSSGQCSQYSRMARGEEVNIPDTAMTR